MAASRTRGPATGRKLCAMQSPTDIRQLDVSAALLRSNARLKRSRELPGGVWLAHWGNADTTTSYQKPGHHTLSIYLQGGHAVRCHQAPSARGEPGSLCSLPAGHESQWDVNGSLQLLHLYLPELQLAESAERWLDLDPRFATLAEQIRHAAEVRRFERTALCLDPQTLHDEIEQMRIVKVHEVED